MHDQQISEWQKMNSRIGILEKRLQRQRIAGFIVCGLLSLVVLSGFMQGSPLFLTVKGIRVVDAAGRTRILLGAPAETTGRNRKDGQTASIVVLGPEGQDRLVIGEAPDPVIRGKTFKRIATAYGMTIHDSTGQERGGMAFLDNGRGVIALDRKGQDAVALIVNDQSGFAGLTMNYEQPPGVYKEAFRLGTKNDQVWFDMTDTSEVLRAGLHLKDTASPLLDLRPAEKPRSK